MIFMEKHLVFECFAMPCVPDPYSALFTHHAAGQCGSVTVWGGTLHHGLSCLVPEMMLLMMHQPHLHQP